MAMNALIHIGSEKAGSSALQSTLYRLHDRLLEHGILYPSNPDKPQHTAHKLLAPGLFPYGSLPRHVRSIGSQPEILKLSKRFYNHVHRQTRHYSPKLLLLSSETLHHELKPDNDRQTYKLLSALADSLRFVVYLRKPSDRYLSGMQQFIKGSRRLFSPSQVHYRPRIEGYERVFGDNCLDVIAFERSAFPYGDICLDFWHRYLSAFGIDSVTISQASIPENQSLTAEACHLLWLYQKKFSPAKRNKRTKRSQTFLSALRIHSSQIEQTKLSLHSHISDLINYSSPDLLWLRDARGVLFSDIDYDKINPTLSERKRLMSVRDSSDIFSYSNRFLDDLIKSILNTDSSLDEDVIDWLQTIHR